MRNPPYTLHAQGIPFQEKANLWQEGVRGNHCMLITHTGNSVVFEPESDAELIAWQPSNSLVFQFVKHTQTDYWIYYAGQFIGCATRLRHEDAWQAVSGSQDWCVAPLSSLEDCGRRLWNRREADLLPS